MITGEHEFEPEQGLPAPLPAGEQVLWQGRPDWRVMAREALHVRKAAVYFVLLIAWRIAASMHDGATTVDALRSATGLAALAVIAVALLAVIAWATANATLYTVTDKRVVMRIGVALTVTFNLPFKVIASAGVREGRGGTGDITLALTGPDRIAWLHLWPHVRPWQVRRPQPMLRCVPQVRQVAQLLGEALARSAGVAPTPLPAAAPASAQRPASADAPMATA